MNKESSDTELSVSVSAGTVTLPGILGVPEAAMGVVLFVHGSGSGRLSPRNNTVARALQDAHLATLLVDLLTEQEEGDRRFVFNIELLAERLLACTEWLREARGTRALPVGYFGASTGAAGALVAAANLGTAVRAVVSRGGRPDLAAHYLGRVQAATLLIVGGNDTPVIALNERALAELRSEKRLVIVPGATHLFEEPGALEEVTRLARDWFLRHLPD